MILGKLKITVFDLSFVYVFLTTVVSQTIIQSEFVRTILSLPSFVLLPYMFGEMLFFIGTLLLKINRHFNNNSIITHVSSWFLGIFSIIVLSMWLQLMRLFFVAQNLHIVVLLCAFLFIISNSFFRLKYVKSCTLERVSLRNSHLILSGLIGLVAVTVVKYFIPFPLPGTGFSDMFFQAIIRMQTHGYVTPFYIRWGDFVVQSSLVQLYNIQPYGLYWAGSFIMVPLFALGMYYLAKDLMGNSYIGVLSALFAVFINVRLTQYSLFYGTPLQHFRSENIIFSIFPITLMLLNRTLLKQNYDIRKILKLTLICGISFLGTYFVLNSSYTAPENLGLSIGAREEILSPTLFLMLPLLFHSFSRIFQSRIWSDVAWLSLIGFTFYLFHKETSLIFSFYMLAYLVLYKMVSSTDKRAKMLIRIALFLTLLYVLLQAAGILHIYTTNPISGFLNPTTYGLSTAIDSFQLKFESLTVANELSTLVLLPVGLMPLLLSSRMEKVFPATLFCFSLLLFFLPDQYTYRAYQVLTPMMAIVLAYSVYWLCDTFASSKKIPSLVFSALLIAVVIPSLVIPVVDRFSSFPTGRQYHSFMSKDEYKMALWLRYNVSEYTVVLSDYKTMQMVVPISNKLWPVNPHHVWIYENETVLNYMKSLRNYVFLSDNDSSRALFLNNINTTTLFWREKRYLESIGARNIQPQILILITSRTSQWLDDENVIYEPLSSSNKVASSYLDVFLKSKHFSLIYEVEGEIYAFLFKHGT